MQYRAEKAGVVHAGIGKASFDEGKIARMLPLSSKPFVKRAQLVQRANISKRLPISSTMGAGVFVEDVA